MQPVSWWPAGTETQVSRGLTDAHVPWGSLQPERSGGTETKNRREEMSVPIYGQVCWVKGVGGLTAGQNVRRHIELGGWGVRRGHHRSSLSPSHMLCPCPALGIEDLVNRAHADLVQTSHGEYATVWWEDLHGAVSHSL